MKSIRRIISFLLAMVMVIGMVPAMHAHAEETDPVQNEVIPTQETEVVETEPQATEAEQTEPGCTGQPDCAAETHLGSCEKKLAEDKAAADLVMEQIGALPALEEVQAKPMAEQQKDYEQVQSVYGAYCALTADQQALLPPAQEVFRPYFDYFNS